MTKTAELLPCPFCGNDELTAEPETTYVMCHGCDADGPMTKPGEAVKAWNTRAAAEDVSAVVEEPAENEQTVYLILFDDYDVRPETVIGEALARQRYAQLSNSWNAHLFVKLQSNSRDDAHANSNYRHPQRPVVLPERRPKTEIGIYSLEDEGYNACLDDIARLSK